MSFPLSGVEALWNDLIPLAVEHKFLLERRDYGWAIDVVDDRREDKLIWIVAIQPARHRDANQVEIKRTAAEVIELLKAERAS